MNITQIKEAFLNLLPDSARALQGMDVLRFAINTCIADILVRVDDTIKHAPKDIVTADQAFEYIRVELRKLLKPVE